MDRIIKDNEIARKMGLSYGQYKAIQKESSDFENDRAKSNSLRFDDLKAFALWQEGKSDLKIAKAIGVSRSTIQQWRTTLELPSTYSNSDIDKKARAGYRLEQLKDGTYVAIK